MSLDELERDYSSHVGGAGVIGANVDANFSAPGFDSNDANAANNGKATSLKSAMQGKSSWLVPGLVGGAFVLFAAFMGYKNFIAGSGNSEEYQSSYYEEMSPNPQMPVDQSQMTDQDMGQGSDIAATEDVSSSPTQNQAESNAAESGTKSNAPQAMTPAGAASMSANMADTSAQVAKYEEEIKNLRSRLDEAMARIEELERRIGQIASSKPERRVAMARTESKSNAKSSTKVAKLQKPTEKQANTDVVVERSVGSKEEQSVSANKTESERTEYIVVGAIAGRAWLRNQDGKYYSVTVDNELPGAGRVVSIDPERGLVTTTLGGVLRFAENDEWHSE